MFTVTLAQLMANHIFVTLQPIAIPTANAFDLGSVLYVNFAVMLYSLNAIPMTFLCIWMYARYSVSGVLRFSMTLLLVGTIFRSLCYRTDNFWPVFLGSYLCSCCNPFFINVQSIIANKWFGDHERALATALQIIAMPLGSASSFAMTGLWFKDEEMDFKEAFKNLMIVQAAITGVVWCLLNLVLKEKPDVPPSSIAEVPYEFLDFRQSFKVMG